LEKGHQEEEVVDATAMSPNAGNAPDLTTDDIVPSRRRRRQLRTGLDGHATVITATGEMTLVPTTTGQPVLGAVRGLVVQLERGAAAGTAADPIIL
jgi:hypothetical protein